MEAAEHGDVTAELLKNRTEKLTVKMMQMFKLSGSFESFQKNGG